MGGLGESGPPTLLGVVVVDDDGSVLSDLFVEKSSHEVKSIVARSMIAKIFVNLLIKNPLFFSFLVKYIYFRIYYPTILPFCQGVEFKF